MKKEENEELMAQTIAGIDENGRIITEDEKVKKLGKDLDIIIPVSKGKIRLGPDGTPYLCNENGVVIGIFSKEQITAMKESGLLDELRKKEKSKAKEDDEKSNADNVL